MRGAGWAEIEDLDGVAPLWRVPAARMKMAAAKKLDAENDHRVPLSAGAVAVAVLRATRRLHPGDADLHGALIFPGRTGVAPIGEAAIGALYDRAGFKGRHVPHGWRASFSTILNERLPEDRGEIDRALGHAGGKRDKEEEGINHKVEGAYNRSRQLAPRRRLFDAWGALLAATIAAERPCGRRAGGEGTPSRPGCSWQPVAAQAAALRPPSLGDRVEKVGQFGWLCRAHDQWHKCNVETVVCLASIRTDSAWFHDTLSPDADIYLLRGRVRFLDAFGRGMQTPFSLMVVMLGSSAEQRRSFASIADGFWLERRIGSATAFAIKPGLVCSFVLEPSGCPPGGLGSARFYLMPVLSRLSSAERRSNGRQLRE